MQSSGEAGAELVSWWDRLTRLGVMASAAVLAAALATDVQENALALAQVAAGNAAHLPSGPVRANAPLCLKIPLDV